MRALPIVRQIRQPDGQRHIIMEDASQDLRLPMYWPNLYATLMLAGAHLANNSIRIAMEHIAYAYRWAATRDLDLDALLCGGEFLTPGQLSDLVTTLRKSTRGLGRVGDHAPNVTSLPKSGTRSKIGAFESARRIANVGAYFAWHIERCKFRAKSEEARWQVELAETALKAFLQSKPPRKDAEVDAPKAGLTPEQRVILWQLIHPDNPDNPFRSWFDKRRNWLLIRTLSATGVRRAENLLIKIEDVHYHVHRISIHRPGNDKAETRTDPPQAKTLARSVAIAKTLSADLHRYIVEVWGQFPRESRQHGFLWTSVKGEPLSLRRVNAMFRFLHLRCPALPPDFSPHSLRYDSNDRLSEAFDREPLETRPSWEEQKRIRDQRYGWSPKGNTAARYDHRRTSRLSDEFAEKASELMDSPFEVIEKIKRAKKT